MKIPLIILLFCSMNCLGQGVKDAQFTVKSIKDVKDFRGVVMTINLKVEDKPADDQTVIYGLNDQDHKLVLVSNSDKNGVINLHLINLKYLRYRKSVV